MKTITNWHRLLTFSLLTFVATSGVAVAQETPAPPLQNTPQKICSSDPVDKLLPPLTPENKEPNSVLSYLAEQGFTKSEGGSWVCYVNDSKKEGRYYTLFKVQEANGKLIGSSFLDGGSLSPEQDNKSLDFFMTLIERHTDINPSDRPSIRRYLKTFITLVGEGKIQPSRRAFLFNQPNRALIMYHKLTTGELKGTAITLNVQLLKKAGSSPGKTGLPPAPTNNLQPNQ